jgi:hypothetical protein
MASPLVLLSGWRGDGALVQSQTFCSTTSTIRHIQTVVVRVPFLQLNKEYKKILSRYA